MSKNLNEQLCDAITAKELDHEYVTTLMKQGADPLGVMNEWGETPISELFTTGDNDWGDASENGTLSDRYAEILELFIQNGFDCSRFHPMTDDDENDELWSLLFSISAGACKALKVMFDHGLSADAFKDFLQHFYYDYGNDTGCWNFDYYKDSLVWAFRMIMLSASYPHILDNNDYLEDCIEIDTTNKDNKYDLKKFRRYEDFDYEFDLSTVADSCGLYGATVTIIEKNTGITVWTTHI